MRTIIKSITHWLGTTSLLTQPRRYIGTALAYRYLGTSPQNIQTLDLITQIKKETDLLLSYQEAFLIYTTVKKTEKIPGDIAEVGVYKGGSAKLMLATTKKTLHLFDTFEGLPELGDMDDVQQFHKGKFNASFQQVTDYLARYPNVVFYQGLFPLTADPIKSKMFSFAHFDVDIYESTLECLTFFYPRMSVGGVMISHDYPSAKGVKKAFDEFFADKPEIIIEPFATGQALVVKI